ncbi:serine hydrolase domain-containing protein [Sphingobium ummariense]
MVSGKRLFILLAALFCIVPATARPDQPDAGLLARWDDDPHKDLRAVIVLRGGRIVAERYFNGETADTLHDIRSAGKSVTALLAGIAIDRGAISRVEDRLATYWPVSRGSPVGDVPLQDILTMRSGLDAFDEDPASPGNEDRMDEAPDPSAFLRAIPASGKPGLDYRYNSATAYAAGIMIAEATGEPMATFAGRTLFRPLGINRWKWDADASGYTKGQGNLYLTARDLGRIGEMVRNGGRHRGKQIVSAQWIAQMLMPRVAIAQADPYADSYGYFWYVKDWQIGGRTLRISFASGNGGNKIYIAPDLGLVVAITSSAYGHGYGQRRSQDILEAILKAEIDKRLSPL